MLVAANTTNYNANSAVAPFSLLFLYPPTPIHPPPFPAKVPYKGKCTNSHNRRPSYFGLLPAVITS